MTSIKDCVVIHASESEDPITGLFDDLFVKTKLKEHFDVVVHEQVVKNPELGKRVLAAFVRPTKSGNGYRYVEDNPELYPNLKIVANHGTGCNHLDIKKLNSRGVKVTNTPLVLGDAVADMAILLMLASARNFLGGVQTAMGPTAIEQFPQNVLGKEVSFSTLGIIGMGDIGYRLAQRAKAFQMKIFYYKRNRRSPEEEAAVNATYCSLDELLCQSDFVVLTCSLNSESTGIIGKEQLAKMKPDATIVNVGRGKLIDQDALIATLKSNKIRGAALDVTDPEPLPRDHPLLKLPNVIIQPHTGSATIETRAKMANVMLENVLACLAGKPPPNEVH